MRPPSSLRYSPIFFTPHKAVRYWLSFLLFIMVIISTYIIYTVGQGSSTAYMHLLYIPIVLSGLMFDIKGGVLMGLLAGFLVGPFLPENASLHRFQDPSLWLFRLSIFVFVGGLCGWSGKVYRDIIQTFANFSKVHPLSGLPNFSGVEAFFKERIQSSRSLEIRCVLIELKHLDEIRQSFGFEMMYKLVRQMGENLKKLSNLGFVGHLDTQHFVLLVEKKVDFLYLMDSCEEVMREVIQLQGISVFLELRYGVVQYPTDDQDWAGLCRKAFLATEQAREQGQRFTYYFEGLEEMPRQNLQLLHDLNQTFYKNQLALFFQPQVSVAAGSLTGVEAIIRWNHPKIGIVSPDQFIPLAEKTLLIAPLTRWILDHAFKVLAEWEHKGFKLKMGVKMSMMNFQDPHLHETIQLFLQKHQVSAEKIEISIEENHHSNYYFSLEKTFHALKNLKSIGIRIAIDNTTSKDLLYHHMLDLPVDTLKINHLLIQQITPDNPSGIIVRNTIQLGKELGLEVAAQGVETQHQYELLKEWGCHTIQGYVVSVPLSGDAFLAWLQSKQVRI